MSALAVLTTAYGLVLAMAAAYALAVYVTGYGLREPYQFERDELGDRR